MSELARIAAGAWRHGPAPLLAFTLAALAVAPLRRPCRRLFGAERAFLLWLLPPLAMLASGLPHPARTSLVALPSLALYVAGAAAVHADDVAASGVDWRTAAMLAWLLGAAGTMAAAFRAQARYRRGLRDARAETLPGLRWRVLHARGADMGPAMVGAWRPRIVLPADFAQRYEAGERVLILAHEAMHARRGDGWWCLLAQCTASLLWFHPLAWWMRAALRHDQELACDAAVLREHGHPRRRYANAMLKTQSAAFALPVGCLWSPRHPITERIEMLKHALPSRRRRIAGAAFAAFTAATLCGFVYAASTPAPKATGSAGEYQVDLTWDIWRDDGQGRHEEKATVALCDAAGKEMGLQVRDWNIGTVVEPAGAGRARVLIRLRDAKGEFSRATLEGAIGAKLHADGVSDDRRSYALEAVPRAGCPARATASSPKISLSVADLGARAAALRIAAQPGLRVVDPAELDERPVSFRFDQVAAEAALKLVAEVDGRKAVLAGTDVHFVPK